MISRLMVVISYDIYARRGCLVLEVAQMAHILGFKKVVSHEPIRSEACLRVSWQGGRVRKGGVSHPLLPSFLAGTTRRWFNFACPVFLGFWFAKDRSTLDFQSLKLEKEFFPFCQIHTIWYPNNHHRSHFNPFFRFQSSMRSMNSFCLHQDK